MKYAFKTESWRLSLCNWPLLVLKDSAWFRECNKHTWRWIPVLCVHIPPSGNSTQNSSQASHGSHWRDPPGLARSQKVGGTVTRKHALWAQVKKMHISTCIKLLLFLTLLQRQASCSSAERSGEARVSLGCRMNIEEGRWSPPPPPMGTKNWNAWDIAPPST